MASPKIFVAGHCGMVGAAICRELAARGQENVVVRSRAELDLTNQAAVKQFFSVEKPDEVYLAAAVVGGIHANNTYPADFIYLNLVMECNVIDAAFRAGTKNLLFLGSSCIYPKVTAQPIKEESLLEGPLEATNEPYAIAKIAGIKLCHSYNRQYSQTHGVDYRCVMPTNLYGPGDSYHPENSHVIPALIQRFHHARLAGEREVTVWGSGSPRRDFLYVDDLATACCDVMAVNKERYYGALNSSINYLNVGYGRDVEISELANLIAHTVGYQGKIAFDTTKPDGTPRKLLDNSRIQSLGWSPTTDLENGLRKTYQAFLSRAYQ